MIDTDIPNKTAAGRTEISGRHNKLGSRQRMLLIAVHGEQTVAQLRQQFHSLGDVDALLRELLSAQLIALPELRQASSGVAPVEVEAELPPVPRVRQFMNDSVVVNLGLRAFLFTLKIERCYSKQELTDLLPEYRRMLAKSLDPAAVKAFSERAEAMIARI